jgi:hypothetical protein
VLFWWTFPIEITRAWWKLMAETLPVPRPPRIVRERLTERCLMCGGIGHWSSVYDDARFCPPPGHRLEGLGGGRSLIVFDACLRHLVM